MRQIFYLFTLVFACALQAEAVPKPTILFIMVDDLGKEWTSSYGADNIQTPHIDKLVGHLAKASNYEVCVCVPFNVNCPGTVPSGVETDALTDFSALLPTFAELGDASLPKGVTLDGKSFTPLLLGKAKDSPREWILAMGHGAGQLDEKGVRGRDDFMDRALRDKRYKVWLDNAPKITRLYDLKTDPMEKKNLIEIRKLEHVAALNKFKEIVDSQPKVDARLQYRPRKANVWDWKPKESLKPKRGNRKNKKED